MRNREWITSTLPTVASSLLLTFNSLAILLRRGEVEGRLGVAVLYGGVGSMGQQEAAHLHPTLQEEEGGQTGL